MFVAFGELTPLSWGLIGFAILFFLQLLLCFRVQSKLVKYLPLSLILFGFFSAALSIWVRLAPTLPAPFREMSLSPFSLRSQSESPPQACCWPGSLMGSYGLWNGINGDNSTALFCAFPFILPLLFVFPLPNERSRFII